MVLIISSLVLISLGSITALVSWLVREDLRIAAEENNFEINRRSSLEAENTLARIRSNSLMLIQMLTSVGTQSALARETSDFFFEQNPRIAALFFPVAGQAGEILLNEPFFLSREIDPALVDSYRDSCRAALRRSALGEIVILNAAPHFSIPLLIIFFPVGSGGAAVLFSPEEMSNLFGFGANQSYMINDSGDLLVHTEFELVKNGVNVNDNNFIRDIQQSPDRSKQMLIYTDFGYDPSADMPGSTAQHNLPRIWEKFRQIVLSIIAGVSGRLGTDIPGAPEQDEQADAAEAAPAAKTVRQFVAFTKLSTAGCIVITGIEYDKVFEGIAATTRRNLYLTAAVLFISIMLIWFFAKSISIPLKALAAAAQNIESGKFDVTLQPRGHDEVGFLTSSFQKMCAALNVFGRFTNREIAVRAMRGEIKPGGLPKYATIFLSDIRGFTELSDNFTRTFGDEASNRLVLWLNEYLTSMVECVEKTGGAVDKFIGDAVVAHWGAAYTTGSPARDAYNCIFAALMMRKAVFEMNRKNNPHGPGNPYIRIGCGISTGPVVAGQIGSELRMEYTVIGDPVNLASRLEALNKPLGTDILISEDTWNLVKNHFTTEEMPPVTVKGKTMPLRIFAVINIAGVEKGPRTLADVRNLLGIKNLDVSGIDINAEEIKYKIYDKG